MSAGKGGRFDRAGQTFGQSRTLPAICQALDGDLDSAVSRLYYAAFYVAEALLDAKGLSFSSHRAVISAYGRQFAKTGELNPNFHKLLLVAFEKRQMGDYLSETSFSENEVDDLLKQTQSFLEAGKAWLINN